MNRLVRLLLSVALLSAGSNLFGSESFSSAVVLSEPGFPVADSAPASLDQLRQALPDAQFISTKQLPALLGAGTTRLFVLPYGSAFPEESWAVIHKFLQDGGNLLVLGGRPFTRSAYRNLDGWKLRDYSVRFTRPLMIDQYEQTPGSEGLQFERNPDLAPRLASFGWKRAFSPVIRLSAVDLYKRGGSAGAIDARLEALAWGVKDKRKLAAPAVQIDHFRNGFDGGRWIFLNAELEHGFFASNGASSLIRALADAAMQGSQEFTARPVLPLYLPGEPIELDVLWHSSAPAAPATLRVAIFPEQQPASRTEADITLPLAQPLLLHPPNGRGLWNIEAKVLQGDAVRAVYRSGFWIRDEDYLRSGPRLSVNQNFFELDGRPLAVVGTTYMSSEVQRLFFEHPNAYVWDRDLGQISDAGLNMIRTGWWTGWDKLCDETGRPYERTLRTIEAYLMTARKHGLPVQFNFFAFLPDVLAGVNPYLDPEAIRRQQTLIASVVQRFHDVPFLAWDLINEPSISQHLWTMRPNGDAIELAAWNQWLTQRYPDRATLASAWNLPAIPETVPLPTDAEFMPRGMYVGHNSLKIYDYFLFAQETFSRWVQAMHDAIRGTGSQQLVTVGQDEGGLQDRLSPAFWGENVDFTTNHSWWQNDFLLWDSLLAKQPGKALLIQETGLQRELNLDETARRTPESEAALLERKIAMSFVQGCGAIEWLWNTNSYMTEGNETPIGAVRPDGTEKPEATLLRDYARFAKSLSPHLRHPQQPAIAIVTSQATHFSVHSDLQLEAQRKAVRALAYYSRLAAYAIAENQIEKLGTPKLAILPSPQALTEAGWRGLLKYVEQGGNLLITGPLDRDEHWHARPRSAEVKIGGQSEPLTFHNAAIHLGDRTLPLVFDQQKQNLVEVLRFNDGSTFKDAAYGKGRIFWAAYPVELAEGEQSTADLYSYVAGLLDINPAFDLPIPLSPGVLIYPVVLEDSLLYAISSDAANDAKVDFIDKLTRVHVSLQLPAQHAALAVIGKEEKAIIGKYGY